MEALQRDTNNGPCFIVIRFPMSLSQTCKNSLIKQLPIHGNYDGRVSGVCPRIDVKEGGWAWDKGVALLFFKSVEVADRWFFSVPEIKQQDWLGGVDIICVPVRQPPEPYSMRFVQLIDLEFHDFDRFRNDYSSEANDVIAKHGGMQLVSSCKAVKLRGMWEPNYLILNTWGSEECFNSAYNGEANQDLKYKRQACSSASMCVFDLEPLICSH